MKNTGTSESSAYRYKKYKLESKIKRLEQELFQLRKQAKTERVRHFRDRKIHI